MSGSKRRVGVPLAGTLSGGQVTLLHKSWSFIPSIATLALWRLRHTWFLQLVTTIGILAAVIIACIVPLFSEVAATAGLRSTLRAYPDSSDIMLNAYTSGLSTGVARDTQKQLDPIFQRYLGPYLSKQTQFSITQGGFSIISPAPPLGKYDLQLFGNSMEQIVPHVTLLNGRFPQSTTTSGEIEAMLTPGTAQDLHVTVGSIMTLNFTFSSNPVTAVQITFKGFTGALKVRVVGLFTTGNDPFWEGEDFQPVYGEVLTTYTMLVPNDAFLATLDPITTKIQSDAVFSTSVPYLLTWHYRLDDSRVTINSLDDLVNRLATLQANLVDKYGDIQSQNFGASVNVPPAYPYLAKIYVAGPVLDVSGNPSTLEQYRNRIAILSIPVTILLLQIIALILYFVSMMADLLVDRQADAIAVLRSRGASSAQIFGSLLTQSVVLGALALVVGPLLALLAVSFVIQHVLVSSQQDALNMITGRPVQAIVEVGWYAGATVLVALLAMSVSLRRATSMDVLAQRREVARSTRRPFWQRLNLDVLAAIIALAGYFVSSYLAGISNLLDSRTKALISVPLTIVAPVFLVLASMLLFLRLFPFLLRLGARLAARSRSSVFMLALSQMARSPRQTVRMIMLLALSIAFIIFTLVFNASQSQHTLDVANYESGADFRGDIPATRQMSLADTAARYAAIPGVISATAGFATQGVSAGNSVSINIQIRAVDTTTFARTALWPPQASSTSLDSLMAQLAAQRTEAISQNVVPVIIDATLQNGLDLHTGTTFPMAIRELQFSAMRFLVIGEVQHIPTVNDSTETGNDASFSPPGGVLIDYATFNAVYQQALRKSSLIPTPLPVNHVWLSTHDDPASLSKVRTTLNTSDLLLYNLYDRRALIEDLSTDPLYLNLIWILMIGAVTALLLALVGDLLASWLSARTRLTNFAVMRALGTTPRQVASVLAWEQGIIYVTALLLGILFGALLSVTVMPALVFTSIPTTGILSGLDINEFYALQRVIPIPIVIPLSLSVAFVVLVILCIVALGMMVRVVSRPSMSQTLRLNED